MLADYHVHTSYSDDSEYPMEQVVLDAMEKGLEELCFTDHVDYGIKRDWDDPRGFEMRRGGADEPTEMPLANVDYPRYMQEIANLRDAYAGKITLRAGMEFGMQVHTIPQYEKLFARYPFDFIILSVHEVEDKEFWTQDFQRGRTQDEYQARYYEEILHLVQRYHDYSVLGHLDLISRYDQAGPYPFERIREIIAEILRTVIADGKGIEVNTSCLRYHLPDLTPSRDILKLYRDLGGTILTIGSDSHKPSHLGTAIRETGRQLAEMGFPYVFTFEKMQPAAHPLT